MEQSLKFVNYYSGLVSRVGSGTGLNNFGSAILLMYVWALYSTGTFLATICTTIHKEQGLLVFKRKNSVGSRIARILYVAHKKKEKKIILQALARCSVADPGCLSQILLFIHPGSWILIFEQVQKKFLNPLTENCSTFYPKKLSISS